MQCINSLTYFRDLLITIYFTDISDLALFQVIRIIITALHPACPFYGVIPSALSYDSQA